MEPLQNKIFFRGINPKLIPKLSILIVFVFIFTAIEANAQIDLDQHTLRVRTEPNILFIGGGGSFASGTTVTVDTAPERWNDYSFVGWKIDGRWTEGNPITVRMDAGHTAVAIYNKEMVGSIIVDSIPRVSEITVDGTIYLPDELPTSFSWPEGSTHIISSPSTIKESPETRYVFDSWKDKSIQRDRTVTIGSETQEFIALFKTQHFLKPITEYGRVIGGGWQDEGRTALFELEDDIVIDKKDDNVRYVFESWDFGDYVNSPSNSIDIIEPVTVKAKWTPQFKLDLKTSIPDYDLFGTGWYEDGKQIAMIAEEELKSSNSDIKYIFDKWISKGPNPVIIPNAQSPLTTILIEEAYIIEASYKESYRVNVWSQYGNPIGGGFYPAGDIATITLAQNQVLVEPNKVRKVFSGWNTFGARTMNQDISLEEADPVAQNLLVFVDKPLNVTTKWKTQYYLDVQSQEGKVKGAGWYDIGRMIPISVDERSTPPGMWSSKVFDRWTGDIESTEMNDRVIMNNPKTVIAEYKIDNTPGIINGAILAGVAGMAALVYTKAQKNKTKTEQIASLKNLSFDKFLSLRSKPTENTPSFYKKPKRNIMDWLMGR
ncbi:MAG: hypothetical protein O6761_01120 [Thaumarchaeota archaeon]|nr:hypothetical protein [Nitrososphaerota archaeon]